MSKSDNEQKIVNEVLDKLSYFKGYKIVDDGESPDFIVSNSVHSIGLEHCLIDTMLDVSPVVKRKKPPASVSRQIETKIHRMCEKDKGLSLADVNAVVDDIKALIQLYNKTLSDFRLPVFELAWFYGIFSHACKIKTYRDRLPEDAELGLVCEIDLPFTEHDWLVQKFEDSECHRQRICGIPMTPFMRDIVFMFVSSFGFDFLIVVTKSLCISSDTHVVMYRPSDMNQIPVYFGFAPYHEDMSKLCLVPLSFYYDMDKYLIELIK